MQLDDINISEYFDSAIMPYGMRLTHLPSGLSVAGNCKHEQSKLKLRDTLTNQLSIFVSQWEGEDPAHRKESDAWATAQRVVEQENKELKARLERLEAMIMRGNGGGASKIEASQPAPKKRGRPAKAPLAGAGPTKAGWTPERRADAAQRMKDRQAAKYGLNPPADAPKVDTPMGEMTEAEFVRRAMRPATDPPQRLPKAHSSHGSTVVKKDPSVKWIEE